MEWTQFCPNINKNYDTCEKLRSPLASQQMADLPLKDWLAHLRSLTLLWRCLIRTWWPMVHGPGQTRPPKKLWTLIFRSPIQSNTLVATWLTQHRHAASVWPTYFRGAKKTTERYWRGDTVPWIKKIRHWMVIEPIRLGHSFTELGSQNLIVSGKSWMTCSKCLRPHVWAARNLLRSLLRPPQWLMTFPTSPGDPAPLLPKCSLLVKMQTSLFQLMHSIPMCEQAMGQADTDVPNISPMYFRKDGNEYLRTLNKSHKWKTPQTCIAIEDVVLVRDKQVRRVVTGIWHVSWGSSQAAN